MYFLERFLHSLQTLGKALITFYKPAVEIYKHYSDMITIEVSNLEVLNSTKLVFVFSRLSL